MQHTNYISLKFLVSQEQLLIKIGFSLKLLVTVVFNPSSIFNPSAHLIMIILWYPVRSSQFVLSWLVIAIHAFSLGLQRNLISVWFFNSSPVWWFFCSTTANLTNLLISRFSGCISVLVNYKPCWAQNSVFAESIRTL